jgi:hypothetical protein
LWPIYWLSIVLSTASHICVNYSIFSHNFQDEVQTFAFETVGGQNLTTTFLLHTKHTSRELACFTWNNSSSSVHLNVSTICSSQDFQMVLDFTPCFPAYRVSQKQLHWFVHDVQPHQLSNRVLSPLSPLLNPKETITNGVISGERAGQRFGPSRPIHLFGKSFIRTI